MKSSAVTQPAAPSPSCIRLLFEPTERQEYCREVQMDR